MIGEYSDRLTEAEELELKEKELKLTEVLMKRARGKDQALEFLNSEVGKSLRKAIAKGKTDAMEDTVYAKTPEDVAQGQSEFQVWIKLESIFGEIITDGIQSEEQLRNILQQSEVTHENE